MKTILFLLQISFGVCANFGDFSINRDLEFFRCRKDFCRSVTCEKITDCSVGNVVPNASYCNCCDACVKYLDEGEKCEENLIGQFKEIAKSECRTGLKCVNGKCVLEENFMSCLMRRKHMLAKQKSDPVYANDIWIPDCDEQGNFKAKQQKKKKSICLDVHGNKLFGQEEAELSRNMTCDCSRHVNNMMKRDTNAFMTKPQEHCTSFGNYDSLQCIDDLCYCAEQATGQTDSRVVKMPYMDKLQCYNSDNLDMRYIMPCEKELQRTRFLRYQFHLKGTDIIGLESIICDPDGTYFPKQCDSNKCVCTNRNGIGIASYFIGTDDYEKLKTEMTCNCARDIESVSSHSQYPSFNCKSFGNYILLQCFNKDQCFCIDEDGDVISKELRRTEADEAFCENLLKSLLGIPEPKSTTTIPLTPTIQTSTTDDDYDY